MLQHDVALAPLTTLEVGGAAMHLVRAQSAQDLVQALAWAQQANLPTFILGGGSNVLVADSGFAGLVIQVAMDSVTLTHDPAGGVLVQAGAGVVWEHLVERTVGEGLSGLQCLAGIPGWVGGAPVQNIGAYGNEVAETLQAVEVVDRRSGATQRWAAAECGLAYRQSHFKGMWAQRYVIVGMDVRLQAGPPKPATYPELQQFLGGRDAAPSVAEMRQAVLELRRRKSMVWDANDANHRSAGSFFTNPVVTTERAAALRAQWGADMPQFAAPGGVKLSAAWMIERSGFTRGYVFGPVGLSSRHALAIINRGQATARDIARLALNIAMAVDATFGVRLQVEPELLGFAEPVRAALQGGAPFEVADKVV